MKQWAVAKYGSVVGGVVLDLCGGVPFPCRRAWEEEKRIVFGESTSVHAALSSGRIIFWELPRRLMSIVHRVIC